MDIVKILAVCFIAAILAVILKQYKPEYSFIISIAAAIMVLYFIADRVIPQIDTIKEKLEQSGVEFSYFKLALKALGIGYITGFVADACRDSGQTSLAAKAELAGKCAIFVLSVPLLSAILQTALGFIGV